MKTLTRYSPLFLKNTELKNRVVVPPTASETSDDLGFATEKTIKHYENLASLKQDSFLLNTLLSIQQVKVRSFNLEFPLMSISKV